MTAQNDIRVWLDEDQESYRRSAAEAIDDTDGMTCPDTFSNCEEALQRMAEYGPPDVILLDVGLPGMSGLEGIPKFLEVSADIRVVASRVRGRRQDLLRHLCRRIGVSAQDGITDGNHRCDPPRDGWRFAYQSADCQSHPRILQRFSGHAEGLPLDPARNGDPATSGRRPHQEGNCRSH